MTMPSFYSLRFFCSVLLVFTFAASVSIAQEEELPTGEEVLDRALEAMGGKAAFDKLENRVMQGKMTMPNMGIEGTIELRQARPNKAVTQVNLPGIGVIEQGTDGETVWELNPLTGPRLITGQEREMQILMNRFDPTDYDDVYESVEVVGIEDVEGSPAYKVLATLRGIGEIEQYFDVESGLEVKSVFEIETQMGAVKTTNLTKDYKEVDGIKMPHRMEQNAVGQLIVTTIESVEHDVELADDAFAVPDEIQPLLESATQEQ